jgi:hypothetical protein
MDESHIDDDCQRNSPIRNHRKFSENLCETTRPPRRLTGGHNMMRFREQEVLIARYRVLEREVTDPLAASLLHIIILEL